MGKYKMEVPAQPLSTGSDSRAALLAWLEEDSIAGEAMSAAARPTIKQMLLPDLS